jgi:prolyl oligopeptidase
LVKLLKRGQTLDQAKELYHGAETDVGDWPWKLDDSTGHHVTGVVRGVTTFEREWSLLTPNGAKRIALPGKASIEGLVDGQIIVTLNEDWKPEGQDAKFVMGSIISLD